MQRTKKQMLTQQIGQILLKMLEEKKLALSMEGESELINFLEIIRRQEYWDLDNAYFAGQTEGTDYCTHFKSWFNENYEGVKIKF